MKLAENQDTNLHSKRLLPGPQDAHEENHCVHQWGAADCTPAQDQADTGVRSEASPWNSPAREGTSALVPGPKVSASTGDDAVDQPDRGKFCRMTVQLFHLLLFSFPSLFTPVLLLFYPSWLICLSAS